MGKQLETIAKTKEKLILTFCELYKQKPIEKITIQEISKKANLNRSTFYQYFTDIYDLLDYLEQDFIQSLRRAQEEQPHSHEELIQKIAGIFDEKDAYLSALLGDYGSKRFLDKIKIEIAQQFYGDKEPLSDPETEYIQEFCLSAVVSLFQCWQKRKKDLPVKEIVTLIQRLILFGLSAYQDTEIVSELPIVTSIDIFHKNRLL